MARGARFTGLTLNFGPFFFCEIDPRKCRVGNIIILHIPRLGGHVNVTASFVSDHMGFISGVRRPFLYLGHFLDDRGAGNDQAKS